MPTYTATASWLSCRDLQRTVVYFRDVLGFRGDWHWFWGDTPDGQLLVFTETPDDPSR